MQDFIEFVRYWNIGIYFECLITQCPLYIYLPLNTFSCIFCRVFPSAIKNGAVPGPILEQTYRRLEQHPKVGLPALKSPELLQNSEQVCHPARGPARDPQVSDSSVSSEFLTHPTSWPSGRFRGQKKKTRLKSFVQVEFRHGREL